PRDEGRRLRPRSPHGVRGDGHGEDGGLGVPRQNQLGLGTLEAQPRQPLAEGVVRGLEYPAGLGEGVGQGLPHAHHLAPPPHPPHWAPLPGEGEGGGYHRTPPAPRASPAPMAIIAMTSPGRSRPARLATSSVVVSEAEEVFPYRWMFTQHFSIGSPSRWHTDS